jgi:hypothetical protein
MPKTFSNGAATSDLSHGRPHSGVWSGRRAYPAMPRRRAGAENPPHTGQGWDTSEATASRVQFAFSVAPGLHPRRTEPR